MSLTCRALSVTMSGAEIDHLRRVGKGAVLRAVPTRHAHPAIGTWCSAGRGHAAQEGRFAHPTRFAPVPFRAPGTGTAGQARVKIRLSRAALTATRNLPLHAAGRPCCQADRQDEGVRKDGHDRLDAISIVTFPSHLVPKKGLRVNESPYHIHDDMRSNLQLLVDRGLSMRGG